MRVFQQFMRNATVLLAVATVALFGAQASAQDKYPDHPIRMIL